MNLRQHSDNFIKEKISIDKTGYIDRILKQFILYMEEEASKKKQNLENIMEGKST